MFSFGPKKMLQGLPVWIEATVLGWNDSFPSFP